MKILLESLVGGNMYGWSNKDSDIDLTVIHSKSLKELYNVNLQYKPKNNYDDIEKGKEVHITDYEFGHAMKELAQNNSNLLDAILCGKHRNKTDSELIELAKNNLSKLLYTPYRGMAYYNQKKYIMSGNEAYKRDTSKKYLFVFRALMTGINALDKGEIVANIYKLNESFNFDFIDDLINYKYNGGFWTNPRRRELIFLMNTEIEKLFARIGASRDCSDLPDTPDYDAINEYYFKVRTEYLE